MRSRVTPAVGSTIDMRLPASQLKKDDLPTLGLPTIATEGKAKGISWKKRLWFYSSYYWLEIHTLNILLPLLPDGIIRTLGNSQTLIWTPNEAFFLVKTDGFILVGLLVATSGFMDYRPTSPGTHPIAAPPYKPIPWLDYCTGFASGGLCPVGTLCIPSS